MNTTIKLIKTSITSHSHFFLLVRMLKIFALNRLQVYNTEFFIEAYLIYNYMLVSGIQQSVLGV